MEKSLLSLINVNKYFGDSHILKNISFNIENGEFLTLLGPSGCGKTTILRCIAELENIDSGDILLNDESLKISLEIFDIKYLLSGNLLYLYLSNYCQERVLFIHFTQNLL